MGRWMSPDWAAKVQPVPYAKLDNPQSLNLYSYVYNNPLSTADPDGHDGCGGGDSNGLGGCAALGPNGLAHPLADDVAVGTVLVGSAIIVGGEIAAAARVAWMVATGYLLSHPEVIQRFNEMIQDAADPGSFRSTIGFKPGALGVGNTIAGELEGGGSAAVTLATNGRNLTAGVGMVAENTGSTLFRLEKGLINSAKEVGATSLTINPRGVTNERLAAVLAKDGYTQIVKAGVKTTDWTKTMTVR